MQTNNKSWLFRRQWRLQFFYTSAKEKEKYKDLCNLISKVNLVWDSMDDDETNVISISFSKIGIILNEFFNELCNAMVSESYLVPKYCTL